MAPLLVWVAAVLPAWAAESFLEPEVAFKLTARAADERSVELVFTVAPGYYLYGDQFKFAAAGGASVGVPGVPAGVAKFDETFQKEVMTHRGTVRITVPVVAAPSLLTLIVTNQGCADKGLCYPPMERAVQVGLAAFGGNADARVLDVNATAALATAGGDPTGAVPTTAPAESRTVAPTVAPKVIPTAAGVGKGGGFVAGTGAGAGLDAALADGRFWRVIAVFFVAGALLSLTPCVLPMVPILSSIIVGEGANVARRTGFALALSYSLGMALVYTALGVAAGLAGEGLAAALQTPWVLGLFAVGLVALALSMFGVYELQLPGALNERLTRASTRLRGGRMAGVFAMGGISALIVSPCVAAPLAGALVYLSQTRDVWLGGTALFSLAAGMSIPLLLVGASAGALLPRAGAWMVEIKHFFGMLLLGVALWTVQPVLPAALALALWGALVIATAVLVVANAPAHRHLPTSPWRRAVAAVLAVSGVMQLVGAASGGTDPLQPLAHLAAPGAAQRSAAAVTFTPVRSVAELDAALRTAGRPVMLDFYADWCVSCKEMERYTFTDPQVQARLSKALLLKADVTANDAQHRELLKRFQLFGPPGSIFFDASGREITAARVIGYENSERFLKTLATAGL